MTKPICTASYSTMKRRPNIQGGRVFVLSYRRAPLQLLERKRIRIRMPNCGRWLQTHSLGPSQKGVLILFLVRLSLCLHNFIEFAANPNVV